MSFHCRTYKMARKWTFLLDAMGTFLYSLYTHTTHNICYGKLRKRSAPTGLASGYLVVPEDAVGTISGQFNCPFINGAQSHRQSDRWRVTWIYVAHQGTGVENLSRIFYAR